MTDDELIELFSSQISARTGENSKNRTLQVNNKSGITGVVWRKREGAWLAQIQINGKHRHLGVHVLKSAAVAARKLAEKELGFHPNHGSSFSVLPPPKEQELK